MDMGTCPRSSFHEYKRRALTLSLYHPEAETSADASSHGLGAVLLQKIEGTWKPIAFASRSLSDTEKRYAQIEKEALASTWACEHFDNYILGKHFLLETDHKPLVPLLSSKDLDKLPPRILRFRLRMMRFEYSIVHVPGKYLYTADALSRAPRTTTGDDAKESEVELHMELALVEMPASEPRLETYRQAQTEDHTCSSIINYCRNGWPRKKGQLDLNIRPYADFQARLSVGNGLLLLDSRIVVPESMCWETLVKLHQGHQGIQRCRYRAKHSVWWPKISQDIENIVKQCPKCIKDTQYRREPLITSQLPKYPWQKIGADLFVYNGNDYLIVVDYFSRFPEVVKLSTTTAQAVIKALKTIFSRHGVPETVMSDNGPQLEFRKFATDYDFSHVTSSPHYPQSNGQVELSVRTVKKLLQNEVPNRALLIYRTTPFAWCDLSPAELLMGRKLRSNLPLTIENLTPNWDYIPEFRKRDHRYKREWIGNVY